MAGAVAGTGLTAEELVLLAELVFAYIDELSAASVAGHAHELAAEDRVRQRHLERLAHGLVSGAPGDQVAAAAERARWTAPQLLAAIVLPEDRVDDVLARIDTRTLQPVGDVPGLPEGDAVLLVPDPGERLASALDRALRGAPAVIGPAVGWQRAGESYTRALRARVSLPASGLMHTDDVLAELVVTADPEALADLRRRTLAPLAGLRPAAAERLTETLRAWLLHRGQRDRVAEALFVHPQTVRYRVGQLRDLFGDTLDDPRTVLELTIALAVPAPPADSR
jgi:DNA-binding PucR family transcriptional regulator